VTSFIFCHPTCYSFITSNSVLVRRKQKCRLKHFYFFIFWSCAFVSSPFPPLNISLLVLSFLSSHGSFHYLLFFTAPFYILFIHFSDYSFLFPYLFCNNPSSCFRQFIFSLTTRDLLLLFPNRLLQWSCGSLLWFIQFTVRYWTNHERQAKMAALSHLILYLVRRIPEMRVQGNVRGTHTELQGCIILCDYILLPWKWG
jgi:hypothetical protein